MKKLRKLLAVLVTVAMAIGMLSMSAFAANGAVGDITVNGAIKDATYTAYKVFDATYSGENNGNVSYTIPTGSTIANVNGFSDTFTTSTNGGVTYVTKKTETTDVIQWLKDNKEAVIAASGAAKATATNSAGSSSILLETGAAGYYLINSTLNDTNAVTVDTAHPTATVESKINTTPSVPNDGKKVNDKTVNTMEVGEIGAFTLTFNATNYAVTNNVPTKITSYTVTDEMDGFTLSEQQKAALTVKVDNVSVSSTESETAPYFTTEYANDVLTIVIHNWDKGNYTSPSSVVVSYNATLSNKHVVNESTNKFTVKYNDTTVPGTPETKTYNYKVVINKYAAGSESTKLSGAKFVLKDGTSADAKFYKADATSGTISWVTDKSQATEVTTVEGTASFEGLKAGTYYLVETEAPAGYNLLTEPTMVTLADITTAQTKETNGTIANLTQTANVANSQGGTLPTTGGRGTTIFYVLGAAFVIGAGIVLVTRRKLSK